MYRPSELQLFLESQGIRPRKGLSQNFLIDGNIVRKIVQAAEICADEHVLEIGPGPGALTQALLDANVRLTAVEKDPVLSSALGRLQTPDERLHVVNADILDFPLTNVRRAVVVANLPYSLTTPILTRLVQHRDSFSRIVVMVQEEVARRMVATHGNKLYGSLSVFLQLQSKAVYICGVSRRCFYPVPKVDSAVVRLDLHAPPVSEPDALFSFTRRCFSTRRKMLRRTLTAPYGSGRVTAALERLGLPETARPEQLSPTELVALYSLLT